MHRVVKNASRSTFRTGAKNLQSAGHPTPGPQQLGQTHEHALLDGAGVCRYDYRDPEQFPVGKNRIGAHSPCENSGRFQITQLFKKDMTGLKKDKTSLVN